MAIVTPPLQRRPLALPVATAGAPPSATVSEWRLAYLLSLGGKPSEEARDASRRHRSSSSTRRHPRRSTPSQRAAQLVVEILNGVGSTAANTYADARRLALSLHNEQHADAPLARDIALALVSIAEQAHAAAELAAVSAGKACVTW